MWQVKNMMKLYKNNIYINRFSVFVYIFIFTLCIFIGSFIDIQEYGINISELQLSYNNLNLYKQWLYILICMLIILKIISFIFSQNNKHLYFLKKNAGRISLADTISCRIFSSRRCNFSF